MKLNMIILINDICYSTRISGLTAPPTVSPAEVQTLRKGKIIL